MGAFLRHPLTTSQNDEQASGSGVSRASLLRRRCKPRSGSRGWMGSALGVVLQFLRKRQATEPAPSSQER